MDQLAILSAATLIAITLGSLLFTYWFCSRIIAAGVRIGLTEARIRFAHSTATTKDVSDAPSGYRWELIKEVDR